ncbi:hypothetical protein FB451DRAFT_1447757 [Mycena latifolia]|nr:hypothetical protein FB451DRAFT_1447757 [Mycena latifolia]
MHYTKLGDSVSLLQRSKSTDASGEQLTEADFDPDSLQEPDTPRKRLKFPPLQSKLIGWPAIVIIGQLLLQALGWGFFVAVKARGQIPLHFEAAIWVKDNSHLVTLLTTLTSTILAGLSLFSYAIRRSVVIYLYRPMSLGTLGASVSIAMRSVVFHRRDWKWPAISIFFFFMAGIQTSGWTTLLTPVPIVISTPLSGSEIDLGSSILYNMNQTGILKPLWFSSINAGQPESGWAAAKAYFGYPSVLTLMNQTFNASTGGILPITLEPVNASTWFSGTGMTTIPAGAKMSSYSDLTGLSTNYSMVQQGFTANISCSFQNLTNETNPDLTFTTDVVANWTWLNVSDNQISYLEIATNCTLPDLGGNRTTAYLAPNSSYLVLLACAPGDSNYNRHFSALIIVARGDYDWLPTTICTMVPQVTSVIVDYGTTINVRQVTQSVPHDIHGPASGAAIYTLSNMLWSAQAFESNSIGIQWSSLYSQPNWNDDQTLRMLEQYFMGVTEYSATALRACLSGKNATFPDGVPPTMSIPTNGTFRTETLGWTYVSGTTQSILLPGTFIAFATIVLVLVALHRHAGDIPRDSDPFDPSNPLHLIAAAAAGGLDNTFRGVQKEEMKQREKMSVVLTSIPGRGPALVRAEEYRPIFSDAFSPRSPYTMQED